VLDLVGRLHAGPIEVRHEEPQKGDMRDTYADTSRARQDLGFTPRISVEQGLEAEFRWLKQAMGTDPR
jgi:UDP-glucose 4-epimerase